MIPHLLFLPRLPPTSVACVPPSRLGVCIQAASLPVLLSSFNLLESAWLSCGVARFNNYVCSSRQAAPLPHLCPPPSRAFSRYSPQRARTRLAGACALTHSLSDRFSRLFGEPASSLVFSQKFEQKIEKSVYILFRTHPMWLTK